MDSKLNKEKIFLTLIENKNQIKGYGVEQIGLFGSFVRNEQNELSDIDFLVKFNKENKTYQNFINLIFFLEEIFFKNVEVVTIESLSPYIGPTIINEVEYAII